MFDRVDQLAEWLHKTYARVKVMTDWRSGEALKPAPAWGDLSPLTREGYRRVAGELLTSPPVCLLEALSQMIADTMEGPDDA